LLRRNLVIIGSIFVLLFHSIMSKSAGAFLVALIATLVFIFFLKFLFSIFRSPEKEASRPRHLKRIVEELKLANKRKSFMEMVESEERTENHPNLHQLEIELEVEPRKESPVPKLPDFDKLFKQRDL
jgi:Ca2+/Na+ antiporter